MPKFKFEVEGLDSWGESDMSWEEVQEMHPQLFIRQLRPDSVGECATDMIDPDNDISTIVVHHNLSNKVYFRNALGVSLPWLYRTLAMHATAKECLDLWYSWPVVQKRRERFMGREDAGGRPAAGGNKTPAAGGKGSERQSNPKSRSWWQPNPKNQSWWHEDQVQWWQGDWQGGWQGGWQQWDWQHTGWGGWRGERWNEGSDWTQWGGWKVKKRGKRGGKSKWTPKAAAGAFVGTAAGAADNAPPTGPRAPPNPPPRPERGRSAKDTDDSPDAERRAPRQDKIDLAGVSIARAFNEMEDPVKSQEVKEES